MRRIFIVSALLIIVANAAIAWIWPDILWSFVVFGPLIGLGVYDISQTRRTLLRNFPIIGHGRYLMEMVSPEIHQYFVEGLHHGLPFSREVRAVIYQRAKKELQTLPFGTRRDVHAAGYEWVNHSIQPIHVDAATLRVTIGCRRCKQPYAASILNISAMSFGSLSSNAIRALNGGAKIGGFAHNTGEGSISPYHLEMGGDLIWQIGTGYFGCRSLDGDFCEKNFVQRATLPVVKMIELKLSQGAKPGHGGILPAIKVTPELAQMRGVSLGKDVISPPGHSAFHTPIEMMMFVEKLRELSGGKPVGIKLCVGKRREFIAICKAMVQTEIVPDYVAVDGGEGGTGAAPLEFSNSVGCPLVEGLIFVHNALVGFGLRKEIRVIAAGRLTTAFDIVAKLAIGADLCHMARGFMFALGCIQALRCNTNHCPTGIATQRDDLVNGLVVTDKKQRVANFHRDTTRTVAEILGAMGIRHSAELRPWHLMCRVGLNEIRHYGELYEYLKPDSLTREPYPASYDRALRAARAESFAAVGEG